MPNQLTIDELPSFLKSPHWPAVMTDDSDDWQTVPRTDRILEALWLVKRRICSNTASIRALRDIQTAQLLKFT